MQQPSLMTAIQHPQCEMLRGTHLSPQLGRKRTPKMFATCSVCIIMGPLPASGNCHRHTYESPTDQSLFSRDACTLMPFMPFWRMAVMSLLRPKTLTLRSSEAEASRLPSWLQHTRFTHPS